MIRCSNCFEEFDEQFDICPHCGYYPGKPAEDVTHLFPGTCLGPVAHGEKRYIIGEVLGFGGFGITYKAWDKQLETVVTIKEYYPFGLVDRVPGQTGLMVYTNRGNDFKHGLERFLDEARHMAKFGKHKNIVNVFTFFEENNTAYIVMEFLDGITLNEFMKFNELDINNCMEVLASICGALKAIHAEGIIHRDVSPDNIFLCLNGTYKLIDFGAARLSNKDVQKLTVIIKPGFAPPEQYESANQQGPWTDVYALGAVLYFMLTRTKPEESTNRSFSDTLIPPEQINPNIPRPINNAIMRAMALDPRQRFSTIEEFEQALFGGMPMDPIADPYIEDGGKGRKAKKADKGAGKGKAGKIIAIVLAIILALGALGFGIFYFLKQKNAGPVFLEMWISVPADESMKEDKIDAIKAIYGEYTKTNRDVIIELHTFEESEYAERLAASMEQEKAIIFESTALDENLLMEYAGNLSDSIEEIHLQNCYFLSDLATYFPDGNQIPLSVQAPMMYVNTALSEYALPTVSDLEALKQSADGSGIAVSEAMRESFLTAFGEAAAEAVTFVEAADEFISGEYAFYYSSKMDYSRIQNKMADKYSALPIETADVQYQFTNIYSVSKNLTSAEKEAAVQFLNYMLGDSAQDYMHSRYQSIGLPINQKVADNIKSGNTELAAFIEKMVDAKYVK